MQAPPPNPPRIALRVTPAAERALRRGHPWLFAEAIQHQSRPGQPGDLAVIFDNRRKFLAIGLYDPTSPIRVRVLQHGQPAPIHTGWFGQKIEAAHQIRAALPPTTNGYRLIHGENDGLPGLVIDRYAQSYGIKIYTPAWIPHLSEVIAALRASLHPQRVILRLAREGMHPPKNPGSLEDGAPLVGDPPPGPVLFLENGLTFEADLLRGQKTGFFLDQRENRARVEQICRGKSVLNLFAYTGGFSLYAARGGALSVLSVDQSAPALEAARRNFAHNRAHPAIAACQHQTWVGDAFEALQTLAAAGRKFEVVVIDPPSFAKKEAERGKALAAYQRLTRLGLSVLAPGGVLVQASCSSRVEATAFFEAVRETARQIGRPLREIERTGHALDHPIRFAEGEYLKCLFARG